MRKRVENYIPKALLAVEHCNIAKDGGIVPKQFNGYISAFGASLRQAGVLATWLFYGNENSSSEEERSKVIAAIEYILGKEVVRNDGSVNAKRDEIEDAATALKLAIRTFKLTKE
jgi:CRISPR-associated protein Cmr5